MPEDVIQPVSRHDLHIQPVSRHGLHIQVSGQQFYHNYLLQMQNFRYHRHRTV